MLIALPKNRLLTALIIMICVCVGCTDKSDTGKDGLIEALNEAAYHCRYVSIDSVTKLTVQALNASEPNTRGRAVALNSMAFVQYMRMDYDKARRYYLKSLEQSDWPVSSLMADVGLMKICQITAQNKEYYDYYLDAERLVQEELLDENIIDDDLTPFEQTLLNYAVTEFYFAHATYLNKLQQIVEAQSEMNNVREWRDELKKDTAQYVRYLQLRCSLGSSSSSLDINRQIQLLIESFLLSEEQGLDYMQANALQQLSSIVNGGARLNPSFKFLLNIEKISDENAGITLAENALQKYSVYGSVYSKALAYLSASDWYLAQEQPEVALNIATKALECVNIQYQRIHGKNGDFLLPWDAAHSEDSISTEMKWMDMDEIQCAWGWIATIREQLSIIYSSMGMKTQSDYNRNIYLDILDATRQDKMLEQRQDTLHRENQKFDFLFAVIVAVAVIIVVFAVISTVIIHKKHKHRRQRKLAEMESEKTVLKKRLESNKRSYIDKCTCISLMQNISPFLNRAIVDLRKLYEGRCTREQSISKLEYVSELAGKINEYNDILSHWIKMRQGEVSLKIENFTLQPIFDIQKKNQNTFDNKNVSLEIHDTDAVVKADRALTLFMVNTLMDNARKFTKNGGRVILDTLSDDNYIEISVSDTGKGLSDEEIKMITTQKVFDSSSIGLTDNVSDVETGKGFGFGLMNCKGIIEKYRKTSSLFDVCTFNVESTLGKGSRFSFRLPKGVIRNFLATVISLLSFTLSVSAQNLDSSINTDMPDDRLLTLASDLTDSVFISNIYEQYENAIVYADSAISVLNMYYRSKEPRGTLVMVLQGGDYMPEIVLWKNGFVTDYHAILQLRNEVAIAALALKDMELYRYNNNIYRRLYTLCAQDPSLEETCALTSKAIHKTKIAINLIILLLIIGIILSVAVCIYISRFKTHTDGDDNRRIEYEDNNLHIQNMVLDNCMSTVKHETMYYPNRIKQIVDTQLLNASNGGNIDVKDALDLAVYYNDIYSLLTSCATRQLDNVQFKRKVISVRSLCCYLRSSMDRQNKMAGVPLTLNISDYGDESVIGDEQMLQYLLDNIISLALEEKKEGVISLDFEKSEEFIMFAFTDHRIVLDEELISQLFYPENLRYDKTSDRLTGGQYLICKQIIREHDEHAGHRGCRIFAEQCAEGLRMCFSIRCAKQQGQII